MAQYRFVIPVTIKHDMTVTIVAENEDHARTRAQAILSSHRLRHSAHPMHPGEQLESSMDEVTYGALLPGGADGQP